MPPLTVLKIGAALIAAFFAVEAVRTRVSEPALQGPTLAQQVQQIKAHVPQVLGPAEKLSSKTALFFIATSAYQSSAGSVFL